MKLIIDTNILISALIRNSITRKIITELEWRLYYPEKSFHEVHKYKKLILDKSGMDEREYVRLLDFLLKNIILVSDEFIERNLERADKLLRKIDPDDVVFLALAISLNANIWSDDKHFKQQKKIKVLTTKDIAKMILKNENIYSN